MARTRLGMALQDLRGSVGGEVFALTRAGLAVRRKPKYKYPKNAAVQAGVLRLKQANLVWNGLTHQQFLAWSVYASREFRVEPITQKRYAQTAKTAFTGLATKFLQINPNGAIPLLPPTADFLGDQILLSVVVDAETHAKGNKTKSVEELVNVQFFSSGANSENTKTEIMFQQLPNVRRSPVKFYKSLAFHAFEGESKPLTVSLEPGVYAFGYKFVNIETGQMTEMLSLGVFQISS